MSRLSGIGPKQNPPPLPERHAKPGKPLVKLSDKVRGIANITSPTHHYSSRPSKEAKAISKTALSHIQPTSPVIDESLTGKGGKVAKKTSNLFHHLQPVLREFKSF